MYKHCICWFTSERKGIVMTLEELNKMRQDVKKKTIICLGLPALVVLFGGVVIGNVLGTIIGVALAVAGGIYAMKARNDFAKQYKEMFVRSSFNEVFDDIHYQPFSGLPSEIISNTKMMNMGDRYSSNDYLEAEYKGIRFMQADVHIEEKHTDSDGDTHYTTLFRGRWMVFDFNKTFKANVQVVQKGFHNAKRQRFFGNKDERYKKVEMEDVAFNESFKVFAQNEHDAFYILTPAMMDRIRKVAGGVTGKVMFCFVDDMLHVAVHNGKDSFEPRIMKEIDMEQAKNDVLGDVRLITDFVDELCLDVKLFKE